MSATLAGVAVGFMVVWATKVEILVSNKFSLHISCEEF